MKTNNNNGTTTITLTISTLSKSLEIQDRLEEEGFNTTLVSYQHINEIIITVNDILAETTKAIAQRILNEVL